MLEKANKIYNEMKDIKYGWSDGKKFHYKISKSYVTKYKFQSCDELEKSRIGNCWETVELTRKYFEQSGIKCFTYFFVIPNTNFFCHSILVFQENDNYYWVENSLKNFKGIRKYNSLEEIIYFIFDNFNVISCNQKYDIRKIKVYEYGKPKDGIGCMLYYFHCFRANNITDSYLNNYLKKFEETNY